MLQQRRDQHFPDRWPPGLLFGPPDAVERFSFPPPRSLVPLAWVLQGITPWADCIACPFGSLGEVAAFECAAGLLLGMLVCAKHAPETPNVSAAARSRDFIIILLILVSARSVNPGVDERFLAPTRQGGVISNRRFWRNSG
ncbi:MAG: hypothetical protein WA926_06915 [Methylovirgula sp.]